MKSSPKAVSGRVVRKKLADGTVKEYRYDPYKAPGSSRYDEHSLGALILAYRRSPEWARLAVATKATYNVYLKELEADPHADIRGIGRKMLLEVRNAIATTRGFGAGTGFVRSASALFGWAVDQDWLEHSPMARVKTLPGGHLPTWSEAHVVLALKHLPEPLRRVVILAMHTGQRRGDLVRLTWSDYDGQKIRLRQQKTGSQMAIKAAPELKAALGEWAKDKPAVTILTNRWGKPWGPMQLTETMGRALEKIEGIPHNLNVHGLRKLAATRLADAGCSIHEIAAITGHRTLGMVGLYTRSADQERLAEAAILRLYPADTTITNRQAKSLKKKGNK